MVLDEASPQAGSSTANNASNNAPSPRPWPANPTLARNFPLKIKPELVVRPDLFTLYFGFFGASNWKNVIAHGITNRVETTWVLTARGPTQEELDAYTTIGSRYIYYRAVELPLFSCLGTAYIYSRIRKEIPIAEGATPRQIFKALRESTFRTLASPSGVRILFIGFAAFAASGFINSTMEMATARMDPRLQQFWNDFQRQKEEDIRKRRLEASSGRRLRGGEFDFSLQVRKALDGYGGYDQGVDQDPYKYDSSASGTTSSESDYASGSTIQQNSSGYQSRSGPDVSREPQYENGPASEQRDARSDFLFGGSSDDDASPTAPEYRNNNADGTPAGSAWDRIRRQSGIPGSQQSTPRSTQQRGQRQNTPASSNYPLNDQERYEYERKREKDQAQADFDRLMEAERNVSDNPQPRGRGW